MQSIVEYAHDVTFELLGGEALEYLLLVDVLLDELPSVLGFVLELVRIWVILLLGLATLHLLVFLLALLESLAVTAAQSPSLLSQGHENTVALLPISYFF